LTQTSNDIYPMQNSLFDLQNRYASLSEAGDPLERLNAVIDWEIFRPILSRIDPTERKSAAGRKPICRVLMFKMLILQRLHNLSDERLQYQVGDRLSFMRFLGLELAGNVPDARTVWAFREALKQHQLVDALFERLYQALAAMGVELQSGQIIDATFVSVPIQRNGRENNAIIKADAVPVDWARPLPNWRKKTVMPAGRRKAGKTIMVTRTTSTSTKTPSSSLPARVPTPAYTTVRCSMRCCATRRQAAKKCGRIAPIAQTKRSKASRKVGTKARFMNVPIVTNR